MPKNKSKKTAPLFLPAGIVADRRFRPPNPRRRNRWPDQPVVVPMATTPAFDPKNVQGIIKNGNLHQSLWPLVRWRQTDQAFVVAHGRNTYLAVTAKKKPQGRNRTQYFKIRAPELRHQVQTLIRPPTRTPERKNPRHVPGSDAWPKGPDVGRGPSD